MSRHVFVEKFCPTIFVEYRAPERNDKQFSASHKCFNIATFASHMRNTDTEKPL